MAKVKESEGQVEPKQGIDPNRPATKEDAEKLGQAWRRLITAYRDFTLAQRNLTDSLRVIDPDADYDALRADAERTTAEWVAARVNARMSVDRLPRGTTGPGGKATRQTVIMEFYGAVNRDLGNRLTPADAKRINRAAWGIPE